MSDEADILAVVYPLFPREDEADDANPVLRRPVKATTGCKGRCQRAELDSKTERAYCRDCGREIPLYSVLSRIASDPTRYIEARKESKRRARLAEARLQELLRLERNAKARLKRLEVPAREVTQACASAERDARRQSNGAA